MTRLSERALVALKNKQLLQNSNQEMKRDLGLLEERILRKPGQFCGSLKGKKTKEMWKID